MSDEKLTDDQVEFLDRLLAVYPGAAGYTRDRDPHVHEIARPLVDAGWVDRYEDEFAEDEAVNDAPGEGAVAYRLSDVMVDAFESTEAREAAQAELN